MGDWGAPIERQKERLQHTGPLLNKIADEVMFPSLRSNYQASGIKTHTGVLFSGITQRGARGNYVRVQGSSVTVGVSYAAIPYAKYVLEGRGPVVAKRAKFLRFVIDGKVFFRKRVGPAPPHRVYFLTEADKAQAAKLVREHMEGR